MTGSLACFSSLPGAAVSAKEHFFLFSLSSSLSLSWSSLELNSTRRGERRDEEKERHSFLFTANFWSPFSSKNMAQPLQILPQAFSGFTSLPTLSSLLSLSFPLFLGISSSCPCCHCDNGIYIVVWLLSNKHVGTHARKQAGTSAILVNVSNSITAPSRPGHRIVSGILI